MKKFSAVLFLLMAAVMLFPCYGASPQKQKFVVVIDAGHGGHDTGANENGVYEKDVNLSVALKLGALIEKKLKDTEVIYTRDNDKFISLQGRANIANNAHADLFISIHCNSVARSNKNRSNVVGATTFTLGPHKDNDNLEVAKRENSVVELDADDSAHFSQFDPTQDESFIIFKMGQNKALKNSVRLADDIQKEMEKTGRVSRGVQQAGFYVLWSTASPAVLVELDFLCNPEEAKFLSSDDGQDQLAEAIYNAVKSYESYYRKNLGEDGNSTSAKPQPAKNESRDMARVEKKETEPAKIEKPKEEKKDKKDKSDKKDKQNKKENSKAKEEDKKASKDPESISDEELASIVAKYSSPDYNVADSKGEAGNSSNAYVNEYPGEIKISSNSGHGNSGRSHVATAPETKPAAVRQRRRPASMRKKEESQVMNISASTENISEISNSYSDGREQEQNKSQKDKKDKKADKNASKKDTKKQASSESSKPARRDKEKTTKRKAVKHNSGNVKYQILLFVSDDELKGNDDAFKGLKPIGINRENNKYNYTYGESSDRKEMENLLTEIEDLFPDARVITRYY